MFQSNKESESPFKGLGQKKLEALKKDELMELGAKEGLKLSKSLKKQEMIDKILEFKKHPIQDKHIEKPLLLKVLDVFVKQNCQYSDMKIGHCGKEAKYNEYYQEYRCPEHSMDEIIHKMSMMKVEDKKENYTKKEKHTKRKKIPEIMKNRIYERDKHKCRLCGRDMDYRDIQMCHIISFKDGGEETEDNLVTGCQKCNVSLGSKSIYQYFKEQGLEWKL